ncbi:MAG TPA: SprT family zinc-dependent metalloprotease [Verrucomicrobiae bacterium]|nr:SprT family zinc-dependent metalloprotease [Verrucomicrobiae bacterium]
MQAAFRFPFLAETLSVAGRSVPLAIVRSHRARRYVLRAFPDGSARLTIPRRGSVSEARQFAGKHLSWLERQLLFFSARPQRPKDWRVGSEILFRGAMTKIEIAENGNSIFLACEKIAVADCRGDLRPAIEKQLRKIAAKELPPLVLEFAAQHQLRVSSVSIRNQRTRWGSCSPRGSISLNWRLIQTPAFVRDYIILHELMHLRQMNHSTRFWREVESVCPDFKVAKKWLKQNAGFLREN